METTQTTNESLNVTRQQLLSLVREIVGGYPNPDDGAPQPGPWDPIIRGSLEHINAFGPYPEPWRSRFGVNQILRILANLPPEIWDVVGGGRNVLDEVAAQSAVTSAAHRVCRRTRPRFYRPCGVDARNRRNLRF